MRKGGSHPLVRLAALPLTRGRRTVQGTRGSLLDRTGVTVPGHAVATATTARCDDRASAVQLGERGRCRSPSAVSRSTGTSCASRIAQTTRKVASCPNAHPRSSRLCATSWTRWCALTWRKSGGVRHATRASSRSAPTRANGPRAMSTIMRLFREATPEGELGVRVGLDDVKAFREGECRLGGRAWVFRDGGQARPGSADCGAA